MLIDPYGDWIIFLKRYMKLQKFFSPKQRL